MTRAWSRGRITGASKRLQLRRYPRSKPICATRPVSEHGQPHMRSPLIAAAPRSRFRRAGLRKTRTILESGISGHGLLRFVYLPIEFGGGIQSGPVEPAAPPDT